MVYLWVSSQLLNVRGGYFVHSPCLGGELGKGWISGAGACVFIFAESSSMQETFQIEQDLCLSPVSNPQLSHIIPGHRADTFSPYGHQPHGHGRGLVTTASTGEAESWLGRGRLPWMALAVTSPRHPSFSQDRDSAVCFLGLAVFVCHPAWYHSLTVTPLPIHLSPEESLSDMNFLLVLWQWPLTRQVKLPGPQGPCCLCSLPFDDLTHAISFWDPVTHCRCLAPEFSGDTL